MKEFGRPRAGSTPSVSKLVFCSICEEQNVGFSRSVRARRVRGVTGASMSGRESRGDEVGPARAECNSQPSSMCQHLMYGKIQSRWFCSPTERGQHWIGEQIVELLMPLILEEIVEVVRRW